MLTSLHIENIAVIERADIEFAPGFNVLTGETGAGKSILIDSIDAVLGGRASREIVRRGAEKALVSAVFENVNADKWLEENDIDPTDELILQRRITPDGKSTCRVCGVPVTAQQLRSLAGCLLDIHGQNDGRRLLDEAEHLRYLDSFAGLIEEKAAFNECYSEWKKIKAEISRLELDDIERERLIESLSYQIAELEKADLRAGEEAELTERRDLLHNSEKLTSDIDSAYAALYEAEGCAVDLVGDAEGYVRHASGYAPELAKTAEALSEARFALQDAAETLADLRRSLDFSPDEYDRLETKLSLLRRLEKKYATDEEGLIAHLDECKKRLDDIEYSSDKVVLLRKKLSELQDKTMKAAQRLSEGRAAAAKKLSERIEDELRYLSMPSVRFEVEMLPVGGETGFCATGCDEVRFLMSANAGAEVGRISKIASGGELSRIMLAMKSVFAENDDCPSLIFDEIDTGVSGIAAQRVGEKMSALAPAKQVICITHLPQIAALADTHFAIAKSETEGKTFTKVTELDTDGRLAELARLHGGDVVTETTLASAREQLEAAQRFKAERAF
ncbi:MAG: DNA repair protein RecN [Oscillospiraceae bacterium]|nr:DNA repair protein RecN [Oscillospiraceae bacterium]